jgi:protein ImuB
MTERRFAEPIATGEAIEHTLLSLGGTLVDILEGRGKGARLLEAAFFRTDGAVRRIAVVTGAPLKDEHAILRLFREKLNALADPLDPGFGFDLIRLSAPRVENFTQEASFDRHREDMYEISALIDRLSARFGAHRVLKFEAEDTHCPEREARLVAAQRATQIALWQKTREFAEPPRRPLRLFEPPEPLQNVLAEVPDGPPAAFVWRRAKHKVIHAEGPERIASEWWQQEAMLPTRDYFRVENDKGQRYWIYREGLYTREMRQPAWFMHGAFA